MCDHLLIPQYRIEHRQIGLTPLVLACDDALEATQLLVAQWQQRLHRFGSSGVLVVIDQETGDVVERVSIAAGGSVTGRKPPIANRRSSRR